MADPGTFDVRRQGFTRFAAEREDPQTGGGHDAALVAFTAAGSVRATWELGPGYVDRFAAAVSGMDLAEARSSFSRRPALGAMTLVRGDGAVFIARRCRHELVEVDLDTGATRHLGVPSTDLPITMVAYLGWTAALGASHTPTVPTAPELALAFLAISLAVTAFLRMHP